MKFMNICINCSNLHNGGGVQVASSFINELLETGECGNLKLSIFVSTEVDENIVNGKNNINDYRVIDTYGLNDFWIHKKMFDSFDLVFTIFGPCYYPIKGVSIVGFAQPWIIMPKNECYSRLSLVARVKTRIKFFLQTLFFKNADSLVVELEHVKKGIVEKGIMKEENIFIVHNTVSSIYLDRKYWNNIDYNFNKSNNLKIGFLGRDYSHKNTNYLLAVKEILTNQFELNVDFFVTLNDDEWALKSEEFKKKIYNIGALKVAQCPNFYRAMDAIIFPSLLECFSATPLETMIMERPLFASDRGFVRDVCGNYAHYFDPIDAFSGAQLIFNYFSAESCQSNLENLKNARFHALSFSNPKKRANEYLDVICSFIKQNRQDNV